MASRFLLFLLAASLSTADAAAAADKLSYADHCGSVVPASTPSGPLVDYSNSFQLSGGYFSPGSGLVDDADPKAPFSPTFYFLAHSRLRTHNASVLMLHATLSFQTPGSNRSELLPKFHRSEASFDLSGFWSESSGQLCMVGAGRGQDKDGNFIQRSAVFKLNYPKRSNISSSLVAGEVYSLDPADSPSHFEPISVFAYAQKFYEYTRIDEANSSCSHFDPEEEVLGLDARSSCYQMSTFSRWRFRLEYGNGCKNGKCGPFGKDFGFLPKFMSFGQMECSNDGRVHMFVGFSNVSRHYYGAVLAPEKSLVVEGFWDQERSRACLVACRIAAGENSMVNASARDCSIGLSLWFPAVMSIDRRSTTVGKLWSNKEKDDASYFPLISFRSLDDDIDSLPGVKYRYTRLDVVKKSCPVGNDAQNLGKKQFPDGNSADMRFDINLRNTKGRHAWGYATPVATGETPYSNAYTSFAMAPMSASTPAIAAGIEMDTPAIATSIEINQSLWNISYMLSYRFPNTSRAGRTVISAEGVYDARFGTLCMVGCRQQVFTNQSLQEKTDDSTDCEILINIQLAALNPEAGEHLTGSIRSRRKESDPLYFGPLEVYSYTMYSEQAVESIWRMDIEITMVLVSLTLSCIFIGYQLFYINKHPDVLPFISIMMLVILTLGHVIPLVLNFEALFFMNRNRQNVLFWSGRWLEVNEVVVRVMTMVALYLQFRFLQVAWSARSVEGRKKGLWLAERKALVLCLPLYFIGGAIAWFVHSRSHGTQQQRPGIEFLDRHSLWEDLISYAGLILDGFLLPQIILNIFSDCKDKALAPIFYVGTTIIRAVPHLYDAYRSRHYAPHFNSSYIYASSDGDLYSLAWDIIVPLEGALFVVLIFLQQRFGGSCILPPRFRKHGGYEMVSEVSL